MTERVNEEQFVAMQSNFIEKRTKCYVVPRGTLVHTGIDQYYNKEYCENNNIPVYHVGRGGGIIVSQKGDIDAVDFRDNDAGYGIGFLQYMQYELLLREIVSEIKGNDLLIDGKKVLAYATYEITQNIFYTAIHVSVTVNIEQIKNICQKAMYKMPAGLSDFGITEKDAENLYVTYANSYDK